MKLSECQKITDEYISQYEEGYWDIKDIMLRLVEEIGELAKVINVMYGSKNLVSKDEHKLIEDELGDVLFSVITIANKEKIELEKIFIKTIDKYNLRDKERWQKKS